MRVSNASSSSLKRSHVGDGIYPPPGCRRSTVYACIEWHAPCGSASAAQGKQDQATLSSSLGCL